MEHRRRRRRLFSRNRCTCGLPWPCPDALRWPANMPIPDGQHTHQGTRNESRANVPTFSGRPMPQIGRSYRLTRGQDIRANGGHRWA